MTSEKPLPKGARFRVSDPQFAERRYVVEFMLPRSRIAAIDDRGCKYVWPLSAVILESAKVAA
jgi:hypothetical protein